MLPSKRPLASVWLVVGSAIAIVLAAITVYTLWIIVRINCEYTSKEAAELVTTSVDLSQKGLTEASFNYSADGAEGLYVLMHVEGVDRCDWDLLDGLEGSIELLDPQGDCVAKSPLRGYSSPDDTGIITLDVLQVSPTAHYTLRLRVDEPAPALAGKAQVLSAKYAVNGAMVGIAMGYIAVFAAITGIPALVIGILVCRAIRRHS